MDADIAKGIAEGLLDPETKEPYPFTNLTNHILKNRQSSNISPTLTNSKPHTAIAASSINYKQQIVQISSSKSTHDSQTPIPTTVSNIGDTNKFDLKQFSTSNLSKLKKSSVSENVSNPIEISAKLNQKSSPCKFNSNQYNPNNQTKFNENILEASSNLKSISKPPPGPLPTIRSSYSKIILGGISKILPSKRKSNQETDKTGKLQKKISSFFGVPRLSPHFPPPAPKSITTESLITNSKEYTQINSTKDNSAKAARPIGVLNLFNPQKGRARRVGLAPAKKNS
jgi:hypothetical protein